MTDEEKAHAICARHEEYLKRVTELRVEYQSRIEDILAGIKRRKLRRIKISIED